VGMMQIGDLDRLWRETVGDPVSRFEILSSNVSGVEGCNLINYSLPVVGKNLLFAGAVGRGRRKDQYRLGKNAQQPVVRGGSADMGLVYDRGGREVDGSSGD